MNVETKAIQLIEGLVRDGVDLERVYIVMPAHAQLIIRKIKKTYPIDVVEDADIWQPEIKIKK